MRRDIKERIEQVRRGEVPEGYTYTVMGIIPATWKTEKLEKHLEEYDVLSNDHMNIPVATSSRDGLLLQSEYYQQQRFEETRIGYHVVPFGYVTYRHMSDDDIFRFNENDAAEKLLVSSEYPVFRAKDSLNQSFLLSYLNTSPYFLSYCHTQKKGSTRTRMYFKSLQQFSILVPSRSEQDRIAEILSHFDKVISLKQQLIEEKSRQKKWLMNCLFANDNSRTEPLGKLCEVIMGQSPESESYNTDKTGLPLIQGGADITNGIATPRFYTSTPTKFCEPNDILLSVRAPVGAVAKSLITACIGRGVCAIRPLNNSLYIYQYLLFYEKKWRNVSQGSTFDAVNGDEIKKVPVPICDDMKKVSSVLSTADREIALLEQELAEEQTKKKALMQLLLTGIVRV